MLDVWTAGLRDCGTAGLMDAPVVQNRDAVDAENFSCGDGLLREAWML